MKCIIIAIEQYGNEYREVRTGCEFESVTEALRIFAEDPPPPSVVGLIIVPEEIQVLDISAPSQN